MLFSLLITVPLLLSIPVVTQIKAFSNKTSDQFLESSLEEETAEDYDTGKDVLCGGHRAANCDSCGNEPANCNADCKWNGQTNKCHEKNDDKKEDPAPSSQHSQQPKQSQKPEPAEQSQQPQKQQGGGGGGDVLCGGHRAPTCAKCGNNAGSCNADCKWQANKCQNKNKQGGNSGGPNNGNKQSNNGNKQPNNGNKQAGHPKTNGNSQKPNNSQKGTFSSRNDPDGGGGGGDGDVLCGGHRAANCTQCGNDAGSCNADCKWEANKCQNKNGQENLSRREDSGDSGDSDCPEKDYDFYMDDIVPYDDSPSADSWQECSEVCRNNNDCKYWTLLSGKCMAKTSKNGKRSKQGAISGSRDCGSNNEETGNEETDNEETGNEETGNEETGNPPSPSENPSPAPQPPADNGGFSDYEQQSLIAHNKFRKMEGAGLSDLVLDQSICQLVKAYASKLGSMQVMDHDYSQGMYENLHMAGAKLSPQEVAQSWMDEKTQPGCTDFACNGHYKIMVNPKITTMCMAADNGGKKNWIVVARYS